MAIGSMFSSISSGLADAQGRFASAAQDVAAGNLNNLAADSVAMNLATVQLAAVTKVAQAADQNLGALIDMLA